MTQCEVCGCNDLRACIDPFDGEPHECYWFAPGICSACRYFPFDLRAPTRDELVPLYSGGIVLA